MKDTWWVLEPHVFGRNSLRITEIYDLVESQYGRSVPLSERFDGGNLLGLGGWIMAGA